MNTLTGTEKQIAWAQEMKSSLIAQLKSSPTGTQLGSDYNMETGKMVIISHGTRDMDRDSRVALKAQRKEKFWPMTPDDLRALAISEMEKIDDAQWWIDNRNDDRSVLAIINTL